MKKSLYSLMITSSLFISLILLMSCYGKNSITITFGEDEDQGEEVSADESENYTAVSQTDEEALTDTRVVKNLDFHSVSNHIPATVYLSQKSPAKVWFEGNQEHINRLETRVKNGELQIRFKDGYRKNNWGNLDVKVYVNASEIRALSVHGSGDILGQNRFNLDDFRASIHGSGNIKADMSADNVDLNIHGSGNIALDGQAKDMDASIHGSGNINCLELKSTSCEASIHGSGNCNVNVTEAIQASIFGSGDIRYRGNPPRIQSKSHGSGSVRSVN